jgi:hypothetical protein
VIAESELRNDATRAGVVSGGTVLCMRHLLRAPRSPLSQVVRICGRLPMNGFDPQVAATFAFASGVRPRLWSPQRTGRILRTAIVLLVVLGYSSALNAQQKPPMSLPQLIELLKVNEQLYSNIDLSFERVEVAHDRTDRPPPGKRIRGNKFRQTAFVAYERSTEGARFVAQGEKRRFTSATSGVDVNGEPQSGSYDVAFDGKTTTSLSGNIANITEDNREFGNGQSVNSICYHNWNCPEPLSKFLAATELAGGSHVRWTALSRAKFDGLDCVGVRCEVLTGPKADVMDWAANFWLAIDRNYIPAKMEFWRYANGQVLDESSGVVAQWKQLQPGIWYPVRTERKNYSHNQTTHVKRFMLEDSMTVKDVSLTPHQPDEFFRIAFPPEATVYKVINNRVVNATEPVPTPVARSVARGRLYAILALNVLVGLCICWMWFRRRVDTKPKK